MAPESLVSLALMEGAVVFRFEMSRIMRLRFRTLHLGLTFDGFEDVMDWEIQWSESIIDPVSSEWTLLVALECLLLESTTHVTLVIDGEVSVLRFWFSYIVTTVERLDGRAFHCFLQLDVWLGSVRSLAPVGTSLDACIASGWLVARWWTRERMHPYCSCVLWHVDSERGQCTPWGCWRASSWQREVDGYSVRIPGGRSTKRETTWWDPWSPGLILAEESGTNRRLLSLS